MKVVVETQIKPMFGDVYEELLKQAKELKKDSVLYTHHIDFLKEQNRYRPYFDLEKYLAEDPNQIVVDYIASMTDRYAIDLYKDLFIPSVWRTPAGI